MAGGELEIAVQQHGEFATLVPARKAQARERPQRRAVELRPRPTENVERAVRIEARLAEHRVARERAQFGFVAQILTYIRPDALVAQRRQSGFALKFRQPQ